MNLPKFSKPLVVRLLTVFTFTVILQLTVPTAHGQTDAPMAESADTHYYDFWPGTWVEVVDGQPDTSATRFTVHRSVHAAAFAEDWRLVYDGAAHHSTALRAWDQVTNRWRLTWVSDNGLYQVWEGMKVGDDWYISREFEIDDRVFLSRQSWIPQGKNRLVRSMERSFDQGQTWETRSRTSFERIAN